MRTEKRLTGGDAAYRLGIVIGQIVGAVFCLSGLAIIILGFNGNIEWFLKDGSFESKISNAGPGVLFALFGAMILWRYKPQHVQQTIETDHWRFDSMVREMKSDIRMDREHAEGLRVLLDKMNTRDLTDTSTADNSAIKNKSSDAASPLNAPDIEGKAKGSR